MDKQIRWSDLGCPEPGQAIQVESPGIDLEHTYLNSNILKKIKQDGCKDAWLVFRQTHLYASTSTILHLIGFIPIH